MIAPKIVNGKETCVGDDDDDKNREEKTELRERRANGQQREEYSTCSNLSRQLVNLIQYLYSINGVVYRRKG